MRRILRIIKLVFLHNWILVGEKKSGCKHFIEKYAAAVLSTKLDPLVASFRIGIEMKLKVVMLFKFNFVAD